MLLLRSDAEEIILQDKCEMFKEHINKDHQLIVLEDIDKCEDNEKHMSYQNDDKIDEFKDNDADASHHNNGRIDKFKDDDNKLNDVRKDNDRDEKKIKIFDSEKIIN